MKKKLLTVVVVTSLATLGLAILVLLTSDTTEAPNIQSGTNQQAPLNGQVETVARGNGAYIAYEDGIIEKTSGDKVLFFHAPWCPQCRAIESDIKKQGPPAGWTIIKVDYDSSQSLRQKYGVTLQTTFVKVGDNGESLGKHIAYNEPSLDAVKRDFLD